MSRWPPLQALVPRAANKRSSRSPRRLRPNPELLRCRELRFKITDATGLLTDSSFECFLGRGRFGAGLGCRRRKLRFCGGRHGPSHNQSRARRCQDACLHGRSRVSHVFAANGKPSKGPKFPDGAWPSQRIGAKRHCPCMLRLAAGGGRRVYLRLKRLPA